MVSRYVHQPQISYLGSITRLSDSRKPGYHTLTTHFGPDRYVHDAWPCEQGVKGIAVHVILRPPTSQCKPTQAPVSKQSMLGDYPNRSGSSPPPESLVTADDYRSSLHSANNPPHPPITVSQSPWNTQVRPPPVRFNSTRSRAADTRLQPSSPYSPSLHLDVESGDTWQGSFNTLVETPSTSRSPTPGSPGWSVPDRGSQDMRGTTFGSDSSSDSPLFHLTGLFAAPPDVPSPILESNPSLSHPKVNGTPLTSTDEFDTPPRPSRSFLLKSERTRPRSVIDDRTRLTKTNKSFIERCIGPVKSLYKSMISRARHRSHRGSRSRGRTTPSEFFKRKSEGRSDMDGASNDIIGAPGSPMQLPELDKNEFLGAEQACHREPEWYVAARKGINLDE